MGEEQFSSADVYRPPVAAERNDAAVEGDLAPHYVISVRKLVAWYFATLGLYPIVWFTKHWFRYRRRTNERIRPIARAIFSVFFVHELFQYIKQTGSGDARVAKWSARLSATAYVAFAVLSAFLHQVAVRAGMVRGPEVASFVLYCAGIIPLIFAQRAANISSGDPGGRSNDSFGVGIIIAIVLSLPLWALALFGIALLPAA